ncbi:MAG: beta-ketoacyl-ACP synthase [Myxococcota bacterium]
MRPATIERVVVTGVGIVSPIGHDVRSVAEALRAERSGIRAVTAWREIEGLTSHVAGLCEGLDLQAAIPRKYRRSMGRVAQLASVATGRAIEDAGLDPALVSGGRVGLAVGSTTGSPASTLDYYANILGPGVRANKSTGFLQVMSHTCAANVALAYGIHGRVWAPSSACTSGSQAIGLGYETLRAGLHDIMLCGGAEEVHYTTAATFDLVGAASSRYNDRPQETPRPFDVDRDGLAVGEGAGMLVLERFEHARARGAKILGEVIGFATTCDGEHITSPSPTSMASCMREALASADLTPQDVDYVNAHATGTEIGDIAEAQATASILGDRVPVSSTKGYVGHTLGACGAIESIFALLMIQHGFVAPTLNLREVDPRCQGLWHVQAPMSRELQVVMNNNFAFGGINTSLLFRAPA